MHLRRFQVLPLCLPLSCAAITNRTIDDTLGDLVTGEKPTYLPDPWQRQDCVGCGIRPPQDQAFMNTYSAITDYYPGTTSVSMEFSFQGTAIYVYFILANLVKGLDPMTHTGTLSDFTLDGSYVSSFHHIPTSSSDFIFNALAFTKGNLTNEKHTLNISTSGVFERFWTCFDYANYTFDDTLAIGTTQQQSPTTTPTTPGNLHTAPVGAIVGGAVGGGLVLAIIIIGIFYLFWKRHRSSMSSAAGNTSTTGGLQPFLLTQSTLNEIKTSRNAAPYPSQLASRPSPSVYDSAIINDETNPTSTASTRQAEIDRRIRELTHEIQVLAGVKTASTKRYLPLRPSLASKRSNDESAPTDQVQQQVDTMRREIENLQMHLHSDWARGLTNDPPPSYCAQ